MSDWLYFAAVLYLFMGYAIAAYGPDTEWLPWYLSFPVFLAWLVLWLPLLVGRGLYWWWRG